MKAKLFTGAAGERYLGLVRQLDCVCCELLGQQQEHPTEAHHPRTGQGKSQKAPDTLAAALCSACHRDRLGVHGDKTLMKILKVDELDFTAMTIARIAGV